MWLATAYTVVFTAVAILASVAFCNAEYSSVDDTLAAQAHALITALDDECGHITFQDSDHFLLGQPVVATGCVLPSVYLGKVALYSGPIAQRRSVLTDVSRPSVERSQTDSGPFASSEWSRRPPTTADGAPVS